VEKHLDSVDEATKSAPVGRDLFDSRFRDALPVSPALWALWCRTYGREGARRLAAAHGLRPRS